MLRCALAGPLAVLLLASGCKAEKRAESAVCLGVPETPMAGRVTDGAEILSAQEEARLSARLARYETATKHQMVVATATTLNGASPMEYATCLGRRWEIGRAEDDDGILILVAPSEHRMSIATGYGMEKILTDEKAKAVIDDHIVPHFRDADYVGGMLAGIEAIAAQTGDPQ